METLKKHAGLIAALIVAVIVCGAGVYFYSDYVDTKRQISELNAQLKEGNGAPKEAVIGDLIAAVSKLIVLPADEAPTVATVNDLEKLKGQPFFVQAKVGDKVLIYTKAKKAILYDPVANKIVEVAPLNLGTDTAVSTTVPGATR